MALLFSATPVAPRHLACRVQRRHLTHIVRHARELSEIALKEEVTGKTFDLNTNNRVEDLPQEFSYYKNATHQIDELELLSEELDSVVSEVDQLLLTSNDLPAFTFADLAHGESSFSYKAAPHSTNLTGAEQGQAAGGRVRSSASQRKPSSTRKKTTPAASEPVDEQPQLVLGSGPSLPPPSMPTVGPSLASSSHDAGMLRPARARVARNRQRVSTLPDSTADQASQHNTQATSPGGSTFQQGNGTPVPAADPQRKTADSVKDYQWLLRVRKDLRSLLKRLPTMEEWALAVKMDAGDFMDRVAAGQNAKSKMLLNNQRMVHLFAKKYNGMGVPYHDLVSEGMLGLERAVEKFDPDLGFRFSTYAHFWIRNAMVRCLQQEGGLVQIPINTRRQNAKINEAQEALRQRLKREPSVEEIAVEVGISVARVKEVKKVIGHASVSSLDKKFKSSESSDMYDIVASEGSMTAEEAYEEESGRQLIDTLFGQLDERESTILRMRMGLHEDQGVCTLEQAGRMLNLTRERVRQLEKQAKTKLQDICQQDGFGSTLLAELEAMAANPSKPTKRISRGLRKHS